MSDDVTVSSGLGLTVVALPGMGHMPAKGEDEQEAARGVLCRGHTGYAEIRLVGMGGHLMRLSCGFAMTRCPALHQPKT